ARAGRLARGKIVGRKTEGLQRLLLPGRGLAARPRPHARSGQRAGDGTREARHAGRVDGGILAEEEAAAVELLDHVSLPRRIPGPLRDPTCEDAVENRALHRAQQELAQPAVAHRARFGAAAEDAQAERDVVVAAEALLAKVVGQAPLLEGGGDASHRLDVRRSAQADGEAVGAQVAGAELVAVARGREHAKPLALEPQRPLRRHPGETHPLRGDGVAILEARDPHVPRRDAEGASQAARDEEGVLSLLLHEHEEVLPLSARRVEGDLVHPEILGAGLDGRVDPGEFGRDVGEGAFLHQRSKALRARSSLSNMTMPSAARLMGLLRAWAQAAPWARPRGASSFCAVFTLRPTKAPSAFS